MRGNDSVAGSFSGTWKLLRGNDSVASVEESVIREKRDQDLISVRTSSDRQNSIISWNGKLNLSFEEKMELSTDSLKLKPIWRSEVGRNVQRDSRTRISNIATTSSESWADQAQREKSLCGEMENRARQFRVGELSLQRGVLQL